MIGRLKPGRTVDQAQAQIDALNARNMERFPQFKEILTNAGFHTNGVAMQADLVRDVRATLFLLWGGVAFVLLIGCVNITNLMLVRSSAPAEGARDAARARRRARPPRASAAHRNDPPDVRRAPASACGAAYWALELLLAGPLADLPRAAEIGLDGQVVAFTIALALRRRRSPSA